MLETGAQRAIVASSPWIRKTFRCNQNIYYIFHATYILGTLLVKNIKFQRDDVAMSSGRAYVSYDLEEG